MKTIINLKTQNKKGNDFKYNHDLGFISTEIQGQSNGTISIDAFGGSGDTYKRRSDAVINIYFGGKLEFEGTLIDLVNQLKK